VQRAMATRPLFTRESIRARNSRVSSEGPKGSERER